MFLSYKAQNRTAGLRPGGKPTRNAAQWTNYKWRFRGSEEIKKQSLILHLCLFKVSVFKSKPQPLCQQVVTQQQLGQQSRTTCPGAWNGAWQLWYRATSSLSRNYFLPLLPFCEKNNCNSSMYILIFISSCKEMAIESDGSAWNYSLIFSPLPYLQLLFYVLEILKKANNFYLKRLNSSSLIHSYFLKNSLHALCIWIYLWMGELWIIRIRYL